jgi:AcrR family transcriptional regulator
MMNKGRPRGRPREETGSKEAILAVARRRFLAEGYDRVTLRSIAQEAGVDVALVSYHYGSKRGLFGAALELPANPPEIIAEVLKGTMDTLPERLLRTVVGVWGDPERGPALRTLAHAAMFDPDVSRLFREMAEREMVGRIAERLGGPDASTRAAVAASQIAGLIFLRYVLRLEPLASLPVDELVARMAPPLRSALAGPPRRR